MDMYTRYSRGSEEGHWIRQGNDETKFLRTNKSYITPGDMDKRTCAVGGLGRVFLRQRA